MTFSVEPKTVRRHPQLRHSTASGAIARSIDAHRRSSHTRSSEVRGNNGATDASLHVRVVSEVPFIVERRRVTPGLLVRAVRRPLDYLWPSA